MALNSMGFDFLLNYNNKIIRKTMSRWVIDNFDPYSKTLNIYGEKIEITPRHVEYLHEFWFKDHGFDVEEVKFVDDGYLHEWVLRFAELDIKGLATQLKKTPHDSPHFRGVFTLFILTTICELTLDRTPKSEWLHLIINDDTIPFWNFASFILKSTVDAIAEFKAQKTAKTLGGCPLLLMAVFCDYSPKDLLKHIWMYDLPRMRDWGDMNTRALHDFIMKQPLEYKTNKLRMVIEKEKCLISGKVPSAHAENVEKAFSLILDKVDRWGNDMNKMFKSGGPIGGDVSESDEVDATYKESDDEEESESSEKVMVTRENKKHAI